MPFSVLQAPSEHGCILCPLPAKHLHRACWDCRGPVALWWELLWCQLCDTWGGTLLPFSPDPTPTPSP